MFQKLKFSQFVNDIENVAVYGQQQNNSNFQGISLEVPHYFVYTKQISKKTEYDLWSMSL